MLSDLCEELVLEITYLLDFRTLTALACTSLRYEIIISDSTLWKQKAAQDYDFVPDVAITLSFREVYTRFQHIRRTWRIFCANNFRTYHFSISIVEYLDLEQFHRIICDVCSYEHNIIWGGQYDGVHLTCLTPDRVYSLKTQRDWHRTLLSEEDTIFVDLCGGYDVPIRNQAYCRHQDKTYWSWYARTNTVEELLVRIKRMIPRDVKKNGIETSSDYYLFRVENTYTPFSDGSQEKLDTVLKGGMKIVLHEDGSYSPLEIILPSDL